MSPLQGHPRGSEPGLLSLGIAEPEQWEFLVGRGAVLSLWDLSLTTPTPKVRRA